MKYSRKKKISAVILAVLLITAMIPAAAFGETSASGDDIVILFSGDVRGQAEANLGYAGLVSYANQMRTTNKHVSLIDAGNAVGGSVLAAVSKGAYSVDAMNLAGYTLAVPGARDFDYGAARLCDSLAKVAEFPYVSCNLIRTDTGSAVFEPYHMVTYGAKKVAYIGISGPDSSVLSSADFVSSYSLCEGNSGRDLYDRVQAAIDSAVTAGADYVIAVANLNSDPLSPYSASAVIGNTVGIHAMIQSGSSAAAGEKVQDAAGNTVLVSCAGSGLKNIGVLTIKMNQTLEAKLIGDYSLQDVTVRDRLNTLELMYNAELTAPFANTSSRLEAVNEDGERVIDKGETNLGDMAADAYRYAAGSDIALVGSAEIRGSLEVGEITYKDVMQILPEGSPICVAEISGADLMDALEMSARLYPNANGGFLQVSGLTYDIQETVIPSVSLDGFGNFRGISGEYRVTNIMVNGKPLDIFSTYTVAGTEELLSGLSGYTMFRNGNLLETDVCPDHLAVIEYLTESLQGAVGGYYAKSQGRVDCIRLARQSELDQQVEDRVSGILKGYEDRIAELEKQLAEKEEILAVRNMKITAASTFGKNASGKRYIKVTWKTNETVKGMKYQIYKSSKKNSGYVKMKTATNLYYKNTAGLKKGNTYYYKVRGYKTIGGKTYYTDWSNIVYRTVKS